LSNQDGRIKKLEVGAEVEVADAILAARRAGPGPLPTKEECERMARQPGPVGEIGRGRLRAKLYQEGADEIAAAQAQAAAPTVEMV